MKIISAHSPRSFFPIIFGSRFPIEPSSEMKSAIRKQKSRMPPYVQLNREWQEEGKVNPSKISDDFHRWGGPCVARVPSPAVRPKILGSLVPNREPSGLF
jgi:hypothetical protein